MLIRAHRWSAIWVAVALLAVSLIGRTAYRFAATSGTSTNLENSRGITAPTRRQLDTAPAAAPGLPAGANAVAPMTLVVSLRPDVTSPAGAPVRQTVTRTVSRIHVKADDRREWLFERNPIDPRRVEAALTDHPSQTIVLYDETSLRLGRNIRGWADALTLGFDEQHLTGYKRTSEARTVGPIRFVRYATADAQRVWWSEDHAIASDFVLLDTVGTTLVTVDSAIAGANEVLLQPPPIRFPTYRVLDIADWQESH